MDASLSVESRKPEAGSLEDRHPGVARAIVTVMNGRYPYFRWAHAHTMSDSDATVILREIQHMAVDLRTVASRFNLDTEGLSRINTVASLIEDEIEAVRQRYDPFAPTSAKIVAFTYLVSQIQTNLFELLVSSFLSGERFWFHQQILEFYLGPRTTPTGRRIRHKHEHEVDIIVQRHDGKHLWVEIKNNAMEWTLENYAAWACCQVAQLPDNLIAIHNESERSRRYGINHSVVQQMSLQVQTRKLLDGSSGGIGGIDILLVSKYPLPPDIYDSLIDLGVQSWPLFLSPQAFLPQFFQAITDQVRQGFSSP